MATPDTRYSSFNSTRDFFSAVRNAAEGPRDRRLVPLAAAPSTYGGESNGADGGFAVGSTFGGFLQSILGEQTLIGLCTQKQTASFSVSVANSSQSPWSNSGPRPKSQPAAAQLAQGKAQIALTSVPLCKMQILLPCTSQVLEDALGFQIFLENEVRMRMTYESNRWLIAGSGTIEPLGLLNAPALLTASKSSGQATGTLTAANCAAMLALLHAPSRDRAVWLFHPVAFAALEGAFNGPSTALDYSGDRVRLYGRPVYLSDACSAFSSLGDVFLVDLQTVVALTRPAGPEFVASAGLLFDYGMSAYRLTLRLGLVHTWASAITAANGGGQLSSVVTLQAR
jgi:HK97 family phage major capsid protein